jgi:hypothetical protein
MAGVTKLFVKKMENCTCGVTGIAGIVVDQPPQPLWKRLLQLLRHARTI